MKKIIILISLLDLAICLHAGQKMTPELILKKEVYGLHEGIHKELNWTSSLDDRRKQGDDYMSSDELQLFLNERIALEAKEADTVNSQASLLCQCKALIMRIIAFWTFN